MALLATFLTLCFCIFTLTLALPVRGNPRLKHLIRATCPLTGFPFADSLFGCKSFKDLIIAKGTSGLADQLVNPFGSTTLADSDVQNINEEFLQPIADSLDGIFALALKSSAAPTFLKSNICLGNFVGASAFGGYKGVCGNLPLKDPDEWTVFGFALEIGPSSPFKALCPGADNDGTFASFCVAVTKDCRSKPSIVLSLSPELFKCQPFDTILATSTAGASEIIVGGLSAVVASYTFGISSTNSFRREFTTFDGNKIIDFTAPGSLYTSGTFSISTDTIPKVPEFFKFTGEAVKMISIDGVEDAVSKTITEFRKAPKNPESALTSMKKVLVQVDFGILYNIKLKMKFAFSKLGKLGNALPDSELFEVGDASIYATTSTVNDGSNSLKPGLYMYSAASPASIMKALFKYGLTFAGEILNAIPDWVPIDIDATKLADKIKTSGDSDDFAVSFVTILPETKAVFMIRAPLIVKELGFIQLQCSIDLDDESFKCRVKTKFGEKIFAAIGETLEDGVMWIAKELKDFGEDFADAGEEILAAGLSTLGDAADVFGSAFSTDTIDSTLKALKKGEVVLDGLGDVGYQISAWSTKTGEDISDIFGETWEDVVTEVNKLGNTAEKAIDEAKDLINKSKEEFNKFTDALADSLGCTNTNTRKVFEGVCPGCCSRAYNLISTLDKVGDIIDNAVDDVIKKVGRFVRKSAEDALKAIGLFSSSSSITRKSTGRRDSYSNCLIYKYYEKRTKKYGFGRLSYKKTTTHHLYDAPEKSCVKAALVKTKAAKDAMEVKKEAEARYNSIKGKLPASVTAASLTKAQLLSRGVTCKSEMKLGEGRTRTTTIKIPKLRGFRIKFETKTITGYYVPVIITCKVPKILADGKLSLGLTTTTFRKDLKINKSSQSSALNDLKKAESSARTKIISSLSENVLKTRR